jgi:hypothetical protein
LLVRIARDASDLKMSIYKSGPLAGVPELMGSERPAIMKSEPTCALKAFSAEPITGSETYQKIALDRSEPSVRVSGTQHVLILDSSGKIWGVGLSGDANPLSSLLRRGSKKLTAGYLSTQSLGKDLYAHWEVDNCLVPLGARTLSP